MCEGLINKSPIYYRLEMFEPKWDRSTPFFETISLSWFFTKIFPKMDRFSSLVTKPLRIFFWRIFLDFFRFYITIHLRVFHNNILSNAAERLQFKDLTFKKYFFGRCVHARGKYLKLLHAVLFFKKRCWPISLWLKYLKSVLYTSRDLAPPVCGIFKT